MGFGIVFAVMIVGAIASAWCAIEKNRNALGWALAGAVLPLISFLILLTSEPLRTAADTNPGY
jgi:Na+/proline symporter